MRYASVCDGIGAAHVAWKPLGWSCAWTSEIEPFPAAVVEQRFGYPNVGDMTQITEEMLNGYGPVNLLVGGTPCQSFSVAGLRGGLADPRGNLALRFVQLAAVMQPQWIVWENVPGVLSSGKGRDFGTFLGALGELGYGFAYRVLDAQWFGVAQRRRRVFVVGYLGDWRRAAAVLFESQSVFGNPPTRGKAGQGITSSPQGIAGNVSSKWSKGTGGPAGDECYNLIVEPHAIYSNDSRFDGIPPAGLSPPLKIGSDGGGNPPAVAVATDLYNGAIDGDVAHSIRVGNGNAMGGVPSAMTFDWQAGGGGSDISFRGKSRSYIVDKPGSTRALTACKTLAVATPYTIQQRGRDGEMSVEVRQDETASCLRQPCGGRSGADVVATAAIGFDGFQSGNPKATHQATTEGTGPLIRHRPHCVATPMAVRRLTPRECERLQGFPDDYTAIEYRKKPAADGPRYRALGNSMAVPVMAWIGERIKMVDERP